MRRQLPVVERCYSVAQVGQRMRELVEATGCRMLVSEGNSDMANFYFHGRGLEDNPPKPGDSPRQMQANIHNLCQPENLGFLGRVHEVFDTYLERMMAHRSARAERR